MKRLGWLVLVSCAGAAQAPPTVAEAPPRAEAYAEVSTDAGTDATPTTDSPDDALAREVAEIRGIPLTRPIRVSRVDAPTFAARTVASPASPSVRATYVAFGFLRDDSRAPPASLGHASYLGLYDFASHELLVKDDLLTGVARGVVVHEMTHALQDQRFGMPEDAEDDRSLAIKALYEGDAMLVRELDAARGTGENEGDRVKRVVNIIRTQPRESLAAKLGASEDARKEPRFGETLSIYVDGLLFVSALFAQSGFAGVDLAYASLPESTEQVLHPDKYLSREAPMLVAAPREPAGFSVLAEGTLGEMRTRLLVGRCSKFPSVGGWGWGGDRFVVAVGANKELALRWSTTWDTEGDAMRFEDALEKTSKSCWPSERRDGYWIGPRDALTRSGTRVEYARGG